MSTRLVALQLPPQRFLEELRRCWDAGEAVLPLPLDAPPAEVDRLLATQRPATVRRERDGNVVEERRPDPLPVEDGTAAVVTTSGSTGEPKGVVLSHAALDASGHAGLTRLGAVPGDRWVLALPLHHVAGLHVAGRAWSLGTEPVLAPADPARWDEAVGDAGGGEHVSLVPTQLRRALDAGVDCSRFRTILLGGAAPDAALLGRAVGAGARVVVSYGMTETCGGCVYDGVPLDGVEVAIRHDGRIRLRGPVLGTGYRGPDGTRRLVDDDGWFTTSDLGRRHAGGPLEVLGRADDVIVSGGENVPAAAVAASLRTHPAVADAAAAGRPDAEWGQAVVAVVVPDDPDEPPTLEDLRTHVRREHPAAYAPQGLVLVDELPRDALGKVRRATLEALVGG